MTPTVYLFSISSHPLAISINSLDITLFKPEVDFSRYDYFIITSKQAVESLKQYADRDLKPALCISKQTAKAYQNIGGEVLEVGSGYGESVGNLIQKYAQSKKWLYLRAKVVASSFVEELKEKKYTIDAITFYKSECSKEIEKVNIKENATLIFTSPSSVKCFLKIHCIDSLSKVIVIGKTTAKALPQGINYIIAKEKTIESCLEAI